MGRRKSLQPRRVSASVTMSPEDLEFLEKVAESRFEHNRSTAMLYYIQLGRAAEEKGWVNEAAPTEGRL